MYFHVILTGGRDLTVVHRGFGEIVRRVYP
jgi:hypothetical protein